MSLITNPKVRIYIYAVIGAALLVLLAYGLLAADKIPVWVNLLTAVLGIVPPALAIPNVTDTRATQAAVQQEKNVSTAATATNAVAPSVDPASGKGAPVAPSA